MKTKTLLAALALVLAPTLASAMCSGHETTAMSCAEGTAWDPETQSCVPNSTS